MPITLAKRAVLRAWLVRDNQAQGANLVVVDGFVPFSTLCLWCGTDRERVLPRVWERRCDRGAARERGVRGVKDVLAAGLAVTACGDDVSPQRFTPGGRLSVKQEVVPTVVPGAAAQ